MKCPYCGAEITDLSPFSMCPVCGQPIESRYTEGPDGDPRRRRPPGETSPVSLADILPLTPKSTA